MPNTLLHIGVQAAATRAVAPAADVKWLLLGAVLPDLPWIFERLLMPWWPAAHIYDLRLYAVVQASALFAVVLCAAFAVLSRRPGFVFALLAANVVLHLLLDASECKWGNGVHLIAPWSWSPLNFELVWPESQLVLGLTGGSLAYLAWLLARRPGEPIGLSFRRARLAAAAPLLLAYFALPPQFVDAALAADNHSIATLRHDGDRTGRPAAIDRATVEARGAGWILRTLSGDEIAVVGALPLEAGTVSLRGRFQADGALHVEEAHRHVPWLRNAPTYLGLAVFATVWAIALLAGKWRWLRRKTAIQQP